MARATTTVKVSDDRGRVVIPKAVRDKLEIGEGDVVELEVSTDE